MSLGRSHLVCADFFPGYVHSSENMIRFLAYLDDSLHQFHLNLNAWVGPFELISYIGKIL